MPTTGMFRRLQWPSSLHATRTSLIWHARHLTVPRYRRATCCDAAAAAAAKVVPVLAVQRPGRSRCATTGGRQRASDPVVSPGLCTGTCSCCAVLVLCSLPQYNVLLLRAQHATVFCDPGRPLLSPTAQCSACQGRSTTSQGRDSGTAVELPLVGGRCHSGWPLVRIGGSKRTTKSTVCGSRVRTSTGHTNYDNAPVRGTARRCLAAVPGARPP